MIYGNFNNFLILIFVDNITDLNLTIEKVKGIGLNFQSNHVVTWNNIFVYIDFLPIDKDNNFELNPSWDKFVSGQVITFVIY